MSTERLPFGFNSLIPETYKSKAEAFAKCLQHKLLSLGRIDPSSGSCGGESRRLTREQDGQPYFAGNAKQTPEINCNEGRPGCGSFENHRKPEKTDDSDEEFCSHSESENSDWTKDVGRPKQKLTSMSSEDSTMDSWSSCQENLTDAEKFDSENEESSSLAAQVKGSPKLRSFNIRTKRKEVREKWKRNARKNHSSSTESIDTEGLKQSQNRQAENFDPEFSSQYILLDGLEPEDDEVPHRILRESSSTSNLEKHFSRDREERENQSRRNCSKLETKLSEESSVGVDSELLTPPPSPEIEKKTQEVQKDKVEDLSDRLRFAEVTDEVEEVDFYEVECMKDLNVDEISRSVRKMGEVIVECSSGSPGADVEVSLNSPEDFLITCVEVHQDTPIDEAKSNESGVHEKTPTNEETDIEKAEDDEILNAHSKMRRCSSLKTWKTPPGTPGGKKIVRFADALGLDLADVRTFLDEIPRIPSSAYEDLHFDFPKSEQLPPLPPTPTLVPLFQQPGSKMDFLEKVQNQKVCLETALVTDEGVLTVRGFVRVLNLCFHKSVHVRYTLNNWETFSDLQATYVPNSSDGITDRFSFVLYGHTLKVGQKLEFALRLECSGAQYWDNNGGINYVLNCLPQDCAISFFSSLHNDQVDPWFDFY